MPDAPPATLEDVHEWVSFEDPDEDRTWLFDATFLTSNWSCLYGSGCPGVLTEPAAELEQGCCSYGAHFTGKADRKAIEAKVAQLGADEWQFKKKGDKKGAIYVNDEGETVSRVVEGACIFLNRPGFPTGPGCALHQAAVRRGESLLEWKPEVCWQLPLRRHDESDSYGHVTSTVREWKTRDWGAGGAEFHWWCTADTHTADAFTGRAPVYETMKDELIAMVGEKPYDLFLQHVRGRRATTWLPHPAIRRKAAPAHAANGR